MLTSAFIAVLSLKKKGVNILINIKKLRLKIMLNKMKLSWTKQYFFYKKYHICNVKGDIFHAKSYTNLQNEWFTFQKIALPSPPV